MALACAASTFFQPFAVIASSISVRTRRSERSLPHFVPIAIEYVLTVEKSKALSKSIFTSCAEASAGSIKADAVIRVRNNFKVHLLMVSLLALARTAPAGIVRHWAGRIDGEVRKGMGSQHAVRPSRTTGVAIRR